MTHQNVVFWKLILACGCVGACAQPYPNPQQRAHPAPADPFRELQSRSYDFEGHGAGASGEPSARIVAASPLVDVRIVSLPGGDSNGTTRVVQTHVHDLESVSSSLRVRVISTYHLARDAYWNDIESLIRGADLVVFEQLHRDSPPQSERKPNSERQAATSGATSKYLLMSRYRSAASTVTGWKSQSLWLRGVRNENWIQADITVGEFLSAQPSFDQPLEGKESEDWLRTITTIESVARGETVRGITPAGARAHLRSHFTDQVAVVIANADRLFERNEEIDIARERVALDAVQRAVASESTSFVVLIYGAAHTPRMVAALRRELRVRMRRSVWIDATHAR